MNRPSWLRADPKEHIPHQLAARTQLDLIRSAASAQSHLTDATACILMMLLATCLGCTTRPALPSVDVPIYNHDSQPNHIICKTRPKRKGRWTWKCAVLYDYGIKTCGSSADASVLLVACGISCVARLMVFTVFCGQRPACTF